MDKRFGSSKQTSIDRRRRGKCHLNRDVRSIGSGEIRKEDTFKTFTNFAQMEFQFAGENLHRMKFDSINFLNVVSQKSKWNAKKYQVNSNYILSIL